MNEMKSPPAGCYSDWCNNRMAELEEKVAMLEAQLDLARSRADDAEERTKRLLLRYA
jgi:hypothetical protein